MACRATLASAELLVLVVHCRRCHRADVSTDSRNVVVHRLTVDFVEVGLKFVRSISIVPDNDISLA